jgi:hypothetical protein
LAQIEEWRKRASPNGLGGSGEAWSLAITAIPILCKMAANCLENHVGKK